MFRTFFRFLGFTLAGLIAVLLLAAGSVYAISTRKIGKRHAVTPASVPIPTDAAALERGRHVVTTRACADCHGPDLGGRKVIDDPAAGVFHGSNLTRGRGGLPADFSDEDFVRAIRHGVGQDGRGLLLMPAGEYTDLSDEDLGAVIAYLKSLPPVDRERGPVSPGPAIRLLMTLDQVKIAANEIDHTAKRPAQVHPEISPGYGKYLAASCTGCHGPDLRGGKIPGAPPDWPSASDLTPATGGAPRWDVNAFVQLLRSRERADGTKLSPVMPAAFGEMTDLELKALWTYLNSLPPAG